MKTLIFIPTYNERENVENIHRQIRRLDIDADMLFLDDASPDGTGRVIDDIAREDARVFTMHRSGKLGIGSAHQDGIAWAYGHGYQRLVTMDCDFTHMPEDIPRFLEASDDYDVVIGSRFMKKDSLSDWNLLRKTLSHLGHFMTRHMLGMPFDATGAFRVYRLDRVGSALFRKVVSKSYSFFFESLYVLHMNGKTIRELPILLPARTYGHSKMTVRDSLLSLRHLGRLFRRKIFDKNSLLLKPNLRSNDEAEWNAYWSKKNSARASVYDGFAEFYRKNIIRRTLNRVIQEEFGAGAKLLHAGCGSGQVDTDIAQEVAITALDISKSAIELYRRHNPGVKETVLGSVLSIPSEGSRYDGVYNLGVMEHFPEEEIVSILKEFNRVLKPHGKVVLFWPPTFGLSVRVLDSVHFVLNNLLRQNVRLHPEEVSRIRSKEHADRLLSRGGFRLKRFYFGPMDLFTHAILIGEKNGSAAL